MNLIDATIQFATDEQRRKTQSERLYKSVQIWETPQSNLYA
jgi:hypothetical protein